MHTCAVFSTNIVVAYDWIKKLSQMYQSVQIDINELFFYPFWSFPKLFMKPSDFESALDITDSVYLNISRT